MLHSIYYGVIQRSIEIGKSLNFNPSDLKGNCHEEYETELYTLC